MATRVEINRVKARKYSNYLALRQALRLGRAVLHGARRAATWQQRTGRTLASIRMKVSSPSTYKTKVTVGSSRRIALLLHEGSPPHLIRPRVKGGLLFFSTPHGRVICFKGTVNHPGFKGYKYLTRPLRREAPRFGFSVLIRRHARF